MDNLPEIKDLHIPDGVSIFPLAYGWWIILGIILCLFLFIKFFLWIIKTSRKYYARKELNSIETSSPITAAIKISDLLKRICAIKYKEASVLYGQKWIDFLNHHTQHKLQGNACDLLMQAPFMKPTSLQYTQTDAEQLKQFAYLWIGANL